METASRIVLTFLLNSLWQAALVAIVAFVACRAMRHGPARHRYAVWAAAFVASVALPLASVRATAGPPRLYIDAVAPVAAASHAAHIGTAASAPAQPAASRATVSLAGATATALLAAYCLFLLFQLGRFSLAWSRTVRIRSAASPAALPAAVRQVWDCCSRAFGIADAQLLFSATVSGPVAAGRAIILPAGLSESGSEEMLTTAIGHEMAHLARRDFGWNLFFELAGLPIGYHPAAWLMRRGIEQSREMACDELVTARLLAPRVYARSIMTIAAQSMALPSPGCTLGVFDGNNLEERIRRLAEGRAANLKRARLLFAGALAGVAACAVVASGLAISARAQTGWQDDLQAAETAYDTRDYKTAAAHFQSVLAHDSTNRQALQGMMMLSVSTKQYDDARSWALKMISAHPRETAGYYTLGFVDWVTIYPAVQQARLTLGIQPQDRNYISDATVRESLRKQYLPSLEDGFRMLQIALQIDPQYSDAMAYMNLLFRLKANLMETPAESDAAIAQADGWVQKAIAARKATGAPAHNGAWVAAPPPPPPPPPPQSQAKLDQTGQQPASATAPSPRANAREANNMWQVVGAPNVSANDLVQQLIGKGFRPVEAVQNVGENMVRVFVGPYSTPEALQKAKTDLEASGFAPLRVW